MTDEKMNGSKPDDPSKVNSQDSKKLLSRMKRSKNKQTEDNGKAEKKRSWVQIRLLPIWLRIILVLLLLIGAAILGAMFGYSILGHGEPGDIFKKEVWVHIFDIMSGKE